MNSSTAVLLPKLRLSNKYDLAGCGTVSSESFDGAQDERVGFDIIKNSPFMLRRSKHSKSFSATARIFVSNCRYDFSAGKFSQPFRVAVA
jgi:hypothetical protein